MKVLLACIAGMSTSLLVEKMKKEVKARGLNDIEIKAEPIENLDRVVGKYDVILLGPQARFKEKAVSELCRAHSKKYAIIPPQVYGTVDGGETLELALRLAEKD
ncbi:MAG TPA: PTS sugar transporter subunit IIB [Thermoanaerobacterales bacterium]|nr:PTS sugar transporter subunit IIB [Thermoanaerobacterales bacterium]